MNQKIKLLTLLLALSLALQACNLPVRLATQDPEAANLELTAIVQQMLIDQAAQQGSVDVAASTPIAVDGNLVPPTEEVVIPAEILPPATGDVTVTVSVATNCRTGPGQNFKIVYGMPVGQVAKVVAKNSYSGYWIIEIPGQNGQTCWLWGQYATLSGNTAGLKDVVTPTFVATLTPTATPTATNTASAVAGCPDRNAANFDPAVTTDDGSCIYDVIVTNASLACEDQLDGTYKYTYTIDWLKNNTVSGLEYSFTYFWEDGTETRMSDLVVVPASPSPIIGTDIKPGHLYFVFNLSVTNPLTKVHTRINPIRLTCP